MRRPARLRSDSIQPLDLSAAESVHSVLLLNRYAALLKYSLREVIQHHASHLRMRVVLGHLER